ncbi:MAG TPA: universal stress protein [Stellaceae bacterium]|nr:universal stress protein [Stellaceae bacterium]
MRQSSTNDSRNRAAKVFLVGTDGSEGGTAALRKAAELAATENAELIVLAVMPREIGFRTEAEQVKEYAKAERLAGGVVEAGLFVAENILEEARAFVGGRHDVAVTYISRAGDPAEEIVACARERSADMLFLGSRGRGPLGAFFYASVSRRVANLAPCTVRSCQRARDERGASATIDGERARCRSHRYAVRRRGAGLTRRFPGGGLKGRSNI